MHFGFGSAYHEQRCDGFRGKAAEARAELVRQPVVQNRHAGLKVQQVEWLDGRLRILFDDGAYLLHAGARARR